MDKKKKLIIEIVLFVLLLISITIIYNYLINKNTKQSMQENISSIIGLIVLHGIHHVA